MDKDRHLEVSSQGGKQKKTVAQDGGINLLEQILNGEEHHELQVTIGEEDKTNVL